MEPSAPGWYPDPYGRHERRYWSGIRWSRHVTDDGRRTEDPDYPQTPLSGEHRVTDLGVADHTTGEYWLPVPATTPLPAPAPASPARARSQAEGRGRPPFGVIAGAVAVLLVAVGAWAVLGSGEGDPDDRRAAAAATRDPKDPLFVAVRKVWARRAGGSISSSRLDCMTAAMIDSADRDRLIAGGVTHGADPLMALGSANKEIVTRHIFKCLDDKSLVAFLTANWRDPATGKSIPEGGCIFKGWLFYLGRDRMTYLMATFATVDPPPLDKTLNPTEFEVATQVLTDCGPGTGKRPAPAGG